MKHNEDGFWLSVCKKMNKIYASHRDVFPNKLLKFGWPDEKTNWDELMYVRFTHHFVDGTEFEFKLDTDYAPINWIMLPALFNIFKDQYIDPTRGRKFNIMEDDNWTSSEKDIIYALPFMIWLDDWDEDESLNIHTCNSDIWDKVMDITDDKSPIWDIIVDDRHDTDLFIGIYEKGHVRIIPEVEYEPNPWDQGMEVDPWKNKISKLIEKGYKPMIIQCAEWDVDDIEVVYWLEAPNKEKRK